MLSTNSSTASPDAADSITCRQQTPTPATEYSDTLFAIETRELKKMSPRGAARRYATRRWQFDPKLAADLRPSADASAVHTSLVAGGGQAAGSQRGAYRRWDRQTDRWIAVSLNAPPYGGGGIKKLKSKPKFRPHPRFSSRGFVSVSVSSPNVHARSQGQKLFSSSIYSRGSAVVRSVLAHLSSSVLHIFFPGKRGASAAQYKFSSKQRHCGDRSFSAAGPRLWTDLPTGLYGGRELPSTPSNNLRKLIYLATEALNWCLF